MAQTKAQLLNPINGNLTVSGVITATSFSGNGSALTGITAGATLSAGDGFQRVVVTSLTSGTMTSAATDAELTYNSASNTLSAGTFSGNITGVAATFTGNVSIGGTLTYEDVTNVDSVGVITARAGIKFGVAGVGGTVTADGHAEFAGVCTATEYYGDGSNLTGISAGMTTESLVSSGVITLNLTSSQDHKVTATGICTITCTGGSEGDSHTVRIVNSGIATVGFSTFFLFPSGSSPALPTSTGAISLVSFTINRVGAGGTQLLAGASVNFS